MMLITEKLIVNVGSMTKNYYEARGYIIPKMKSKKDWKLEISVNDLPKTSQAKVEVSCEMCGEFRTVVYRDLTRSRKSKLGKDGKTYCGDCSRRVGGNLANRHIHGNPLYNIYKGNAVKRHLEWSLTPDEFVMLNAQACHYCGGVNEYARTSYTGNGIDRMDNTKGYIKNNCVPCCSICNRAKNAMVYADFLNWIKRLQKNVK